MNDNHREATSETPMRRQIDLVPEGFADSPFETREVTHQLNCLLFQQSGLALIAGLLVAVFATRALWPIAEHEHLRIWLGLLSR